MNTMPIIQHPNPILRERSKFVDQVDDSVRDLASAMLATMYEAKGVGLAAIQVAVPKRLVVVDVSWPKGVREPITLINPEIVYQSETRSNYREGCLSIPGMFAEIERPSEVRVEYLDINGDKRSLETSGILAICIQHEIDHLNGVLFTDYLDSY